MVYRRALALFPGQLSHCLPWLRSWRRASQRVPRPKAATWPANLHLPVFPGGPAGRRHRRPRCPRCRARPPGQPSASNRGPEERRPPPKSATPLQRQACRRLGGSAGVRSGNSSAPPQRPGRLGQRRTRWPADRSQTRSGTEVGPGAKAWSPGRPGGWPGMSRSGRHPRSR